MNSTQSIPYEWQRNDGGHRGALNGFKEWNEHVSFAKENETEEIENGTTELETM